MKTMVLTQLLGLVCILLFIGCSRPAAPVTVTDEAGRVTINYHVAQPPELKPQEWPALIVFLGRASGPILDKRIVEAEEMRRGMAASSIISTQSSFFYYQIAAEDSSELAGYRFDIYDTEAKEIRPGEVLKISFDRSRSSPGFPASSVGPDLDWDWLGSEAKVQAALAGFKTEKGDFKFQRFLTPIVASQFKTGM